MKGVYFAGVANRRRPGSGGHWQHQAAPSRTSGDHAHSSSSCEGASTKSHSVLMPAPVVAGYGAGGHALRTASTGAMTA